VFYFRRFLDRSRDEDRDDPDPEELDELDELERARRDRLCLDDDRDLRDDEVFLRLLRLRDLDLLEDEEELDDPDLLDLWRDFLLLLRERDELEELE